MARQIFRNNVLSMLAGSLASGATSLSVSTGSGTLFPSPTAGDFFLATLYETDPSGNETRFEVVQVTARSGDVLTIVRDFESMTGSAGGYSYPSSAGKTVYFDCRWTAYAANNSLQAAANLGDLASASIAKTNLGLGNVDNTSDATVLAAAAADATAKSNAAISASAPVGHVGSGGSEHANVVAAGSSGFMSGIDKSKLDGIAAGANAYEHPANHLPSIITQDSSNRFVSDAEKSTWGSKQSELVSGTNIKTVNGSSLLGSGDLTVTAATMTATVGGSVPTPPNDASKFLNGQGVFATPPGGGGAVWGSVSGTLSDQTDLQTALNGKEPAITTGTSAQYIKGDKTLGTMPTTLPASDVYSWAKAATKPTYTYAEVGAQPAGTYATGTGSASGTNTGDNAVNSLYSGLVSNANHTGDATGSTALTVVKINGTLMSGLATGLLKNTTETGVPSIAVAGTDYQAPLVSGTNIKTIGGTSILGSGNISLSSSAGMSRSERTSNVMLSTSDSGSFIDAISGTFTQTFDAAATLGSDWWCYYRNSGTSDITLDPNASETIDGISGFVMYPGAVRLIHCDGAVLRSIPIVGGTKVFATPGTANFVWAPGINQWDTDLRPGGGGGGGGARSTTQYNGGGGGAGERIRSIIHKSQITVGGSTSCTVGSKGVGGAAASVDSSPANATVNAGTNGKNSSIGSFVLAKAGGGGQGAYTSSHGQGGVGGGSFSFLPSASFQGIPGHGNAPAQTAVGSNVYPTEWGGPNGWAGDTYATGIVSILGRTKGGDGGGYVSAGSPGADGANPGDGGGGGAGNLNGSPAGKGGDGADGQITIVEVI